VGSTWEEENRPIDLHVHTTASDGDMSPAACVDEAKQLGLAAIAITDHDTVAGNAEAEARGQEVGVEVVPGVEVSVQHERLTVHLLGYYPQPGAVELERVLAGLREHREERNPRILRRLAELGCPVAPEELAAEAAGGVPGRPHMAALMIRKGYVKDLQEAFDRYLAKGAAAYVEGGELPAAAAIRALLKSGAVPVLAHPGGIGLRSVPEVELFVRRLVDVGLRGIEAYYPGSDSGQTSAWLRLGARHGLVVTGGTDFHRMSRAPRMQIGRGAGDLRVPYGLLVRLRAERAAIVASTRTEAGRR